MERDERGLTVNKGLERDERGLENGGMIEGRIKNWGERREE